MANIEYFPGNGAFAAPTQTFDITSVVAKRVGSFVNYYSFDTDGTMFVLHSSGGVIVGWQHFSGSMLLQSGATDLVLQPFLDNMYSRNPSSIKAMAYFLGTDDLLTGSRAKDVMVAGAGNDTLSGGEGRDQMSGGAGADHLVGGAGADKLTGGLDADHFVFNSANDGADRITDFAPGADQIDLSGAAFGLAGPLVDGISFVSGGAPTTSGATVLYDATTGALSFDADGSGSGTAVTLALLTNHAALTVADILVF